MAHAMASGQARRRRARRPGAALGAAVGVLAAANVLNNTVARRYAPLTSAVATGALLLIARGAGAGARDLGFASPARGALIGGGLAAAVAAGYTGGVLLPPTRRLFMDERALALTRARLFEEALLQVPVGTVLLEEVAFRGVLPELFGHSFKPRTASVASNLLFGLWHVLPALDMARANPAAARAGTPRLVAGTVATTTLAGLGFHELRRRGGLLAPALLHLATNSLGFVAARGARRMDARRTRRSAG
uniref:CPBP family intramembrane glutamic endopeptidase n=1 Tax=Herbidospora sakaeratensis TaxID=564415 RepID=UPI001FE177EC|nr:CPBP family intramembrane glutamic endopeptidase [Herbidospora sakaeratensis]